VIFTVGFVVSDLVIPDAIAEGVPMVPELFKAATLY
jgi:hypothetical protein